MTIGYLFREIMKGRTLLRALQNDAIREINLKGKVIDLGAKSDSSSYYQFINKNDNAIITYTDFFFSGPGIIKLNLEDNFPIESNEYDMALLNNTLEHLYNHQNCINEIYRILKPGGRLIGLVPYLMKIHPDPDDYFRYTASSLRRILSSAGFNEIRIKALGFGPFTAGVFQFVELFYFGLLKAVILFIAIVLDRFAQRIFPSRVMFKSERYPITYFFEGGKEFNKSEL